MQEHYIYCHLTYTQAACPPSVTLIYYKLSNTISGAVLQPHGCRKTPTKGHWTLRDLLVNIRSYADESASDGKWNVYEVRCRKKQAVLHKTLLQWGLLFSSSNESCSPHRFPIVSSSLCDQFSDRSMQDTTRRAYIWLLLQYRIVTIENCVHIMLGTKHSPRWNVQNRQILLWCETYMSTSRSQRQRKALLDFGPHCSRSIL